MLREENASSIMPTAHPSVPREKSQSLLFTLDYTYLVKYLTYLLHGGKLILSGTLLFRVADKEIIY